MALSVGAIVRVPLHGRRVRGWVTALDPHDSDVEPDRLQPVATVASCGPDPELVGLAGWASVRWAAGRMRPFLVAASPRAFVAAPAPPARSATPPRAADTTLAALVEAPADALVVVPPTVSPLEAVVVAVGPARCSP